MANELQNPVEVGTGGLKGIRTNETGSSIVPRMSAESISAIQGYTDPYSSGIGYVGDLIPEGSKYNENIKTFDDLENYERFLSEEQPWWLKATNSVISGGLMGLATALQDVSYLLDFKTHGETLGLIEDTGARYTENQLATWAKEIQEGIRETLPVYEDPTTTGITDSFLRWSTLREGLNSIVGFGLAGYGAGAAVKGTQLALKAGMNTARVNAYKNILSRGLSGIGAEGTFANAVAAGALQNYAEGTMLAFEFQEEAKETLINQLREEAINQGISDVDAYIEEKLALDFSDIDDVIAQQMDNIMDMNKVFWALDVFGLHGIFKGEGLTRSLVKQRGIKPFLKSFAELSEDNLVLQGVKEFIEEASQNAFQSEAEYQTKLQTGQLTEDEIFDHENAFFKRMLDFATTDDAILEGLMGFFSGGPQRMLTQATTGAYSKSARERYNKGYADQQAELNSYTSNEIRNIVESSSLKEEALSADDIIAFDFMDDTAFGKKLSKAFQLGTTEQIEAHLQDVVNTSQEEAIAKGWDENYQEKAQKYLDRLQKYENVYIKYADKANRIDLVNRQIRMDNLESLTDSYLEDARQRLELLNNKYGLAEDGLPYLSYTFNKIPKKGARNYNIHINAFKGTQVDNEIKGDPEYKSFKEVFDKAAITNEKLIEERHAYAESTTKEGELKYQTEQLKKQIEEAKRQQEETILTKADGQIINILDDAGNPRVDDNGNPEPYKIVRKNGQGYGAIYAYNPKEQGFTTKIRDIESIDEYEAFKVVNQNPQQKAVLTPEESKAIINQINSFDNADELVDFIKGDVLPNNYAANDLIRSAGLKKYNELTGKNINNLSKAEYQDNIYHRKENPDKKFVVTKSTRKGNDGKLQTSYFLNSINKINDPKVKGTRISPQQLEKQFEYESTVAEYKDRNKEYFESDIQNPSNVEGSSYEMSLSDIYSLGGAKKLLKNFFSSTTGTWSINGNTKINPNKSQRDFFSFVNTHNFSDGKFKGRVEYVPDALNERIKSEIGDDYKLNDVLLFFVTNNNGEYIDIDGNPTNDFSKAIYSTIRVPNAYNENGTALFAEVTEDNWNKLYPKAKSYEDAIAIEKGEAEYQLALTKALREEAKNGSVEVNITGKSVGQDNKFDKDRNAPKTFMDVLNKPAESIDVQVATSDVIYSGGEAYSVHPGFVYVIDKETGNIYKGNIDSVSAENVNIIYKAISSYVQRSKITSDGRLNYKDKSNHQLKNDNGDILPNRTVWGLIGELVFWTGNNYSNGKEINTNNRTRFHFVDDFHIRIGDRVIPIFELNENGVPVINAETGTPEVHNQLESNLREFFPTQFYQVSNTLAKSNDPYYQITGVNGDGVVTYKRYNTYREFLLDNVLYSTAPVQGSTINIDGEVETYPSKVGQYLNFSYPQSIIKSATRKEQEKKKKVEAPREKKTSVNKNTDYNSHVGKELNLKFTQIAGDQEKTIDITYRITGKNDKKTGLPIWTIENITVNGEQNFAAKEMANFLSGQVNTKGEQGVIESLAALGAQVKDVSINIIEKTNPIEQPAKEEDSKPVEGIKKNADKPVTNNDLSTKKRRSVKPSGQLDDSKKTRPGAQRKSNRKERISRRKEYYIEDIKKMRDWFEQKFPGVPFNVIYESIEDGVHGAFINGALTLNSQAEQGTVYHEAFHIVYDMFMPSKLKPFLIQEAKNDPEMQSYISEAKQTYNNLSENDQIEEALAEAFRDYMLARQNASPIRKTLFQRMKDFVNKLINLFKDKSNKSFVNDTFQRINENQFIATKNKYKNDNPDKFRKVKGKDYQFTKDAVEGLHYFFMEYLQTETKYGFEALFALDRQTNIDIIDKAYKYARTQIEETEQWLRNENDEESIAKADDLKYILDNWYSNESEDSVTDSHREYIKQFNLELSGKTLEEETYSEALGDETERGRDSAGNGWGQELKFGSKLNASKNIKLLVSGLTKAYFDEDGELYNYENGLGLNTNVNFGETFSILVDAFANTTGNMSINDISEIIDRLASKDPSIGGLRYILKLDKDVSDMTQSEINLILQFAQTFTKNKNIYEIDLIGENGQFISIDANTETAISKVKYEWSNNYNQARFETYSEYYYEKEGNVYYNEKEFKKIKNITKANIDEFLEILGIEYSQLQPSEGASDDFLKRANHVLSAIKKGNQKVIFARNNDSDLKGDLDYFANVEIETGLNRIENAHYNIDGELVYDSVLQSYWNNIINNIYRFNSYEEMVSHYPHLDKSKVPYLTNSLLLDKLFSSKERLKIINVEGSRELESGIGKSFADLKPIDKLLNVINNTLKGRYNMLRPADNSIERFYSFGEQFVTAEQLTLERGSVQEVFINYLRDELYRAGDNQGVYKNYNDKRQNNKTGVWINIFSKAGVSKEITAIANGESWDNSTTWVEYVDSMMNNEHLRDQLKIAFNEFLSEEVSHLIADLEGNQAIRRVDGNWQLLGIDNASSIVNGIELQQLLTLFKVNDMIAITEQHKVFLADPAYYKSVQDEFKRHNGSVGTKKIINTSDQVNQWIADNLKRSDNAEALMSRPEIGTNKPIIRTIVFDDIQTYSKSLYNYAINLDGERFTTWLEKISNGNATEEWFNANLNTVLPLFKKEGFISQGYADMTEGDGAGYVTLDEYREFLFRTGDWNLKLEKLYQWEMSESKGSERPFTDPNTKETKMITKKDIEGIVFNSLKPQYFGPMAEEGFRPTMYKLSLQPLIPSVIQGTNLEKLANTMKNKQVGIAVHYSANKGVTTKLNEDGSLNRFYDDNGEYNLDNYGDSLLTQDTFYEFWGIQLDTGNKPKNTVITGTQMMKQIINGLKDKGSLSDKFGDKSEYVESLFNEYIDLNSQRINLGFDKLVNKLGLIVDGDGDSYSVQDPRYLIDTLVNEAISRNSPDNILEGIYRLEKGLTVDSLVNREKIENILYGLSDSTVNKQKRFGKSSYQQTPTGFELGVKRDFNDGTYSSSDLNFYMNKDGKVTQMEVYLPNFFKGIINIGELDSRLLDLIGFRIPTQGLVSIESIKVKGFLDSVAGDIIVMPSEIVAKAGSDYDIDKLNIYLPNFEYENGKPKYIEYIKDGNSEELFNRWLYDRNNKLYHDYMNSDSIVKDIKNKFTEFSNRFTENVENSEKILQYLSDMIYGTTGLNRQFKSFKEAREFINTTLFDTLSEYNKTFERINEINATLSEYYRLSENDARNDGVYLENWKKLENERNNLMKQTDFIDYTQLRKGLNEIVTEYSNDFFEELQEIKEGQLVIAERLKNQKEAIRANLRKEFEKLDINQKNGIKAVENRITEIQKELLLMPENFNDLMSPINTDTLKAAADLINDLRNNEDRWNSKVDMDKLVDRLYLTRVAERYMRGKASVGITALGSTFHIMAQENDIRIAFESNILNTTAIDEDGYTPLGALYSTNNEYIPLTFNQWISAAVDAAKEPFMSDLNASPQTLGTILALTMAGVSSTDIALFMNQPIVRDYVANQEIYESQNAEANTDFSGKKKLKKYRNELKKITKEKYSKKSFAIDKLSTKEMRDMISDYHNGSLTLEQKQKQVAILDAFLSYQDDAKLVSEAIQASTYDTRGVGKNTSELFYMANSTRKLIDSGKFKNYDRLMGDGFISPYYKNSLNIGRAMKPLFTTLSNQGFMNMFNDLYNLFTGTKYITDENGNRRVSVPESTSSTRNDVVNALNKFKTDFVAYLIQTRDFIDVDGNQFNMNSQIDRLFYGDNSVAERLYRIKQNPTNLEQYPILNILTPIIRDGDIHSIQPFSGKIDPIDSNIYTQSWRDIIDANPRFGYDLIYFALLQSGLQNSPMSFVELIPIEHYSKIVDGILSRENESSQSYQNFMMNFFISNSNDRNIVPRKQKVDQHLPFYRKMLPGDSYEGKSRKELKDALARGENVYTKSVLINRATGEHIDTGKNIKDFALKKSLIDYSIKPVGPVELNGNKRSMDDQVDYYDSSLAEDTKANTTESIDYLNATDNVESYWDTLGYIYEKSSNTVKELIDQAIPKGLSEDEARSSFEDVVDAYYKSRNEDEFQNELIKRICKG